MGQHAYLEHLQVHGMEPAADRGEARSVDMPLPGGGRGTKSLRGQS